MTQATELEAKVMRAVATNCYNAMNYGIPKSFDECNNPVWTDCINDAEYGSGVEGKSLSGVISSLSKKSFAGSDAECIWLTQAGYDAMVEFFGGNIDTENRGR